MIRTRVGPALTGAALLALLTSAPARADEVRAITSGVVQTIGNMDATFDVSGTDFHLSGTLIEGIGDANACRPCAPGETIPFRSNWSGDITGRTTAVVDGKTYSVVLGGEFGLNGGEAIVPDVSGSTLTMQRSFTLGPDSGFIGWLDDARTQEAFRFHVTGGGLVTLTAHRSGSIFDGGEFKFTFSSLQGAPTPEPASIVLLLTALGGFAAARRSRTSPA